MPYYHVYIEFEKKGKETNYISYNNTEKTVREDYVEPFLKNQRFFFISHIIEPSTVSQFAVFKSEKEFKDLILPKGKSIMSATNNYILYCFLNEKVKGVAPVTHHFITSPPKKREEPKKIPTEILEKRKKYS